MISEEAQLLLVESQPLGLGSNAATAQTPPQVHEQILTRQHIAHTTDCVSAVRWGEKGFINQSGWI